MFENKLTRIKLTRIKVKVQDLAIVSGVGATILADSAFALGGTVPTTVTGVNSDIQQAFQDGQGSVALAVTGIIAMAAVITGLALVFKWLAK